MTQPDQQLVREIAREATRRASRRRDDIDSVISTHNAMEQILASGDRKAYGALWSAVRDEMKAAEVTVTWPDGRDDSLAMLDEVAPTGPSRVVAEYWHNCAFACSDNGRNATWTSVAHVAACILGAMNAEQDERNADDDRTEHLTELLAAVTDPACERDGYGNCATHGVLTLEPGAQCPHALARAFLAGARLHTATLDARTTDGGAT